MARFLDIQQLSVYYPRLTEPLGTSETPPMPTKTIDTRRSVFADRRVRFAVSGLLIGHLWAVIGRPLEFATQGPYGTSPSASTFFAPVRGYSQFAYLDHGYAFFAPEPGPSHFFQAAITDAEGKRIERKFPELADQWPRLLYHRHFMLAEFFNDVYHPPGGPPPEIATNAAASADWVRGRKRFDDIRNSMLHHLQDEYPRCTVAIRRVEHRQPGLPEFFDGKVGTRDERLLRIQFDTIDGLPPQDSAGMISPTETLAAPPAEATQ